MLTGCCQRWLDLDMESNQRGRRGGTWLQALDPITKKNRQVTVSGDFTKDDVAQNVISVHLFISDQY